VGLLDQGIDYGFGIFTIDLDQINNDFNCVEIGRVLIVASPGRGAAA
jgi:hypothetical protein